MLEFWASLVIFMASHSVIARSGLRGVIAQKWGERTYLTLYSLLSLILLAWLIIAAQNAPRIQLWPWLYELYWIPNIFMPLACILLVSGFVVPNPLSIAAKNKGFDPERPGFIELPPIKESISGVNLDRLWATLGRHINGEEAIYGGADNRLFASG